MALLPLDASTPAQFAALHDPWVSPSFTPPNDSLIVLGVMADWFGGTPTITPTSSGLTFVSRKLQGANNQGIAQIFTAEVGSNGGVARTVSITTSISSDPGGAKIWVLPPGTFDPVNYVDAVGGGGSTVNALTVNALTTVSDNALVLGIGTDWQNLGAPTSTDVFENSPQPGGGVSIISVRKAAVTSPAGVVTLNFDAAGTGTPQWTWAAIAIKPASASTAAVGKDLGLVWNTRAAVNKDLALQWNVRSIVNKNLALQWAVRSTVAKTLVLQWNVRAAVGKSLQLIWNELANAPTTAVGKDLGLVWNTRAVVGKNVALQWNVRAVTRKDLALAWRVREALSKDLTLRWNVLSLAPEIIVDIEVTIGPTRRRNQADAGPTRQDWKIGDSRKGWTIGETRKDR